LRYSRFYVQIFNALYIRPALPESTTSYDIEDLVIARYQGGCFTRGMTRTMEILLEHRYSASWMSRMTDVIYEKVEDFRHRKKELWYPIVFLDGVVLKIRRDSVAGEVGYVALGIGEDGYKGAVKRRTKVIEVFPHPDATAKVMYWLLLR
jgi:transposase-like protein